MLLKMSHIYIFILKAKEKKGQTETSDETHHCSNKHSVRHTECEGVRLWHDVSGALLSVHPQPLQQAQNQSIRLVRACIFCFFLFTGDQQMIPKKDSSTPKYIFRKEVLSLPKI